MVQAFRRAILGAPLAFALALSACGEPPAEPSRASGEISIAFSSQSLTTAPVRLAQEMGLFDKHGLKARFVAMDSGSMASSALVSGSVDFSVIGLSDVVIARSRGQKIVVVTNIYDTFSGSAVLSKAAVERLGVSPSASVADRLKALDGVVMGSPSPVSAYTFSLMAAARSAGARPRMTYLAQTAMASALRSGAIEGYISSAPYWTTSVIEGSSIVWLSGPRGEFPRNVTPSSSSAIETMQPFAEANPDIIRKLSAVFADFAAAVDQRPAEVKAAVAKLYPSLDADTVDMLFETESLGWTPDPLTPEDLAYEIAFVKASGSPLPDSDNLDPAAMIFSPD